MFSNITWNCCKFKLKRIYFISFHFSTIPWINDSLIVFAWNTLTDSSATSPLFRFITTVLVLYSCSLRGSNIFVYPGDPCEFYTITNPFADHWCDTSHNWTLAWLNSLLKSLVLTAATWKAAANPFHIPWAIHQRFPLFRSELDLGIDQDNWTIHYKSITSVDCTEPILTHHWTLGWVFGTSNIACKYIYDHFSYR